MASAPSFELKRHFRKLSTKETEEVVEIVADLIVGFLKGQCQHDVPPDMGHADGASNCSEGWRLTEGVSQDAVA